MEAFQFILVINLSKISVAVNFIISTLGIYNIMHIIQVRDHSCIICLSFAFILYLVKSRCTCSWSLKRYTLSITLPFLLYSYIHIYSIFVIYKFLQTI